MPYIELHARSAFSFLRGAAMPRQLIEAAASQDIPAVALCDRDGVYGAPRFFAAAKKAGVRPIVGSELTMEDGSVLPVLVESRRGYENLCRLLTRAKLRGTKEASPVQWNDLPEFAEGVVALFGSSTDGPPAKRLERITKLVEVFGVDQIFVEIQRHHVRGEQRRNQALVSLARQHRLPLLATNGVLYAAPPQREVLDVFTCARHHTQLDKAGRLLEQNTERHLKGAAEMTALFHDLPEAIENTQRLAERLDFTLENLGYEFPRFPVSAGETMESMLRQVTYAGARARYSHLGAKVKAQLERELALIEQLGFAGYFLIVWDLVNFCTQEGIMVQGRGSAANSVVCYSLGITACDPIKHQLLFERFLSEGRKSWPDIDLDLPSGDRRERVIQEVYRRYGERGAAMTANVITYRGRSAAREIGKALNFSNDVLDRFSNLFANGDFPHTLGFDDQMAKAGIPRDHPRTPAFMRLYEAMHGLPRHLGQHSGGMIICQGRLDSIVPLERASMPGRVVAQWDKDDCDDLGMIKVDLLGLGMMAVLQETIELTRERGREVDLAQLPLDDVATYDMMCSADTIGVFQIESRAQMATLPRMKPRCFYDVCIEVAIIRPGPIQGHLMHPYLARRAGKEPVTYYHPDVEPILKRTLGVPLFQEQMLSIAMIMADFTGSQAEELRRALSFHRSQERMQKVQVQLREAMEFKGLPQKTIEEVLAAITSFALYGFPESHAISFALLAYGSAWLKMHRAPEFFTALLNNQPMGFYAPATLIKDGQRRGVKFRPICAQQSQWACTIDGDGVVRLGLCCVRGFTREHADELIGARPFESLADLQKRVRFGRDEWRTLAEIGAFKACAEHRRAALWVVEEEQLEEDLFAPGIGVAAAAPSVFQNPLPRMSAAERLRADYAGTGLTIAPHPMALLRSRLPGIWCAVDLPQAQDGQRIRIGGNVICRQRPGTARGFVFISLEDETGISNAIVHPWLFEQERLLITEESFLIIEGVLQARDGTWLVQATNIEPLDHEDLMGAQSYDFH